MFPSKDALTICFAHAAYQMQARFDVRKTGIRNFQVWKYDDLEKRIDALREQEQIDALRPELDGYEIGAVLGIPPGPDVGRAYRYLLELRLDGGPIGTEAASAALRQWAAEHGVGS